MTIVSRLSSLFSDDLTRRLVGGSLSSLVIKISASGLSFLMFLALARVMSPEDFGRYGFAFSLVTALAAVGSFGLRSLVLRYIPIHISDGRPDLAAGLIRVGYAVIFMGCATLGAAVLALGVLLDGASFGYFVASAVFVVVLALAEYQPNVLRAYGSLGRALVPRDILWRAVVVFGAVVALIHGTTLSVEQAIWLTILSLAVLTLGQAFSHASTNPVNLWRHRPSTDRSVWTKAAMGLWGTSLIQALGPNIAVVLLGLMFSPQETGPFFAALRTAMLMHLFLMASNMVVAPMLSRSFHEGDLRSVQRACNTISIGVGVPTMAALATFALFGREILDLFGPGYSVAYWPLVIMSAGYTINALAGPTMQIMEMSGNERTFFKITLATSLASIALILLLGSAFGTFGVAIALALEVACWNLLTARWIWRHLKVLPFYFPLSKAK